MKVATVSSDRFDELQTEMIKILGLDGGEVKEEKLKGMLCKYFGDERAALIYGEIQADVAFFRDTDPASGDYSDEQILSVRRGMSAIAAHRIFGEILVDCPKCIYGLEVIAKYVQKDTNVEIHPCAKISVPFAIDHGHGTVVGATSTIGKNVFIYHGVTLGASGLVNKAGRRHPNVGDCVFFGNGSQVLGPSVLKDNIQIASGALIRDSLIHSNVRVSMKVRIAGVEVPENARIFADHPENRKLFWAQLDGQTAPSWIELPRFNAEDNLI